MAKRRNFKRDRNGRFAKTAGGASKALARRSGSSVSRRGGGIVKRGGSTVSTGRTRVFTSRALSKVRSAPVKTSPSRGFAAAAVVVGTVGVAAGVQKYRKSPGRKKRKAQRAKQRANFRRQEDRFARSAAGREAYGD